jgi:DNA-binding NarL/FixJ family response regulator
VTTSTPLARAAERVSRLCAGQDDALTLRRSLLDELGRCMAIDHYAWLLTDPETEVGCAPLADVPSVEELPRLIRLKYLTPLNRWTSLDTATTLVRATSNQPARSLIWRELLRGHGVSDVASVVFRDRFGCWAFLDLWRVDPAPPFDGAEVEFLRRIAPPVTDALRRAQARTFDVAPTAARRAGPIVLVMSPRLEVGAQTPDTEEYLRTLVPPDGDRRPIPAAAYNVGAQVLAVEAGVDDHPPSARVHLADGAWLTVRAARMGDGRSSERDDIAVTIESASPEERLGVFVRAWGLSARETELVELLTAGSDTRHVAREMVVSEHTVQDHLKSIFAKTGARTRHALLARALGR